jgi:hypothetical protein
MADEAYEYLAWAIRALREDTRQKQYRWARRYYDGDHRLTFATEKFRNVFGQLFTALADNLCPAVVDSVSDRLRVDGVDPSDTGEQAAADAAWEIWKRNRMDVRAPETHHESLLTGDGYALVWPDEANQAVIWSIPACDMAVSYDPNKPGLIRRAARVWHDEDDQRSHIDVYLPDQVLRWVSRKTKKTGVIQSGSRPNDWEPYFALTTGGVESLATIENPYGRVPVVHFPNRRYHGYGVSELRDVFPLQDALNKTLCDMMVAQEFSAFPQRWATGIDVGDVDDSTGKPVKPPFDYGIDRMLTAMEVDAKFGSFLSSDLRQYVEVQENLRSEIARVSGTPLHYLFITRGDFPSGEAMKSAEARFTRKVEQRQEHYGNQWEDVLALALKIEGNEDAKGSMLSLEWEPASPVALPAGDSGAQPGVTPAQSTTIA